MLYGLVTSVVIYTIKKIENSDIVCQVFIVSLELDSGGSYRGSTCNKKNFAYVYQKNGRGGWNNISLKLPVALHVRHCEGGFGHSCTLYKVYDDTRETHKKDHFPDVSRQDSIACPTAL